MQTNRLNGWWLMVLLFVFSAFVIYTNGYIKGKVVPAANAVRAIAIKGTDTAVSKITDGNIDIGKLNPGIYTLWIEATDPYKSTSLYDVQVREGEYTDVGIIRLEKK